MTDASLVAAAVEVLTGAKHKHAEAVRFVPSQPGLYAFYGDERAWDQLDVSPTMDGQPLYVGTAERRLNGRDVGTHFRAGMTGSSTVRRSLAALLMDEPALVAVPRNLAKPDGSAHFALDGESESRLSHWMEQRLGLTTWTKPDGADLDEIETAAVRHFRPPLNLDKVGEPRTRLREARRQMAADARAWTPPQ